MIQLRAWQAVAIPLAIESMEAGRAEVTAAVTGAGKAIAIAEIVRRWREVHPDDVIVVAAPTIRLVEQLGDTLIEVLGPGIVGRFFTHSHQTDRPVIVVCNKSAIQLSKQMEDEGRTIGVLICDEVHRTENAQMQRTDGSPVLRSRVRHGFTATPFLANAEKRISMFDKISFRYSPADALRDGVICPFRVVGWDEADTSVDEACVAMLRALGPDCGPAVVNAKTIDDAQEFAERLTESGIDALAIHSRLSGAEQAAVLRQLLAGEIRVVVHVNLLSEGVDIPPLRVLCLRRPVGSRLRNIQELGRVLRILHAPDQWGPKVQAIILDPIDQLGKFALAYDPMLGWSEPIDGKEETETEEEEREIKNAPPDGRTAVVRAALARYVRQLLLAMTAEGVRDSTTQRVGPWRQQPASEKQTSALANMVRMAGRLDKDHTAAVHRIVATPGLATRGICSDLFEILRGCRALPSASKGGHWSPANPVALPPESAYTLPELTEPVDDAWYVAGVVYAGWAAGVVMQGETVLYVQARPARAGDTWQTITAGVLAGVALPRYGVAAAPRGPAAMEVGFSYISQKMQASGRP